MNYAKNAAQVLCGVLALLTIPSQAAEEAPRTLKGATVISAEKAKAMQDQGVQIIDTRVAQEYSEHHVKGSKNIPYKEKSAKSVDYDAELDSFDLSQLPKDKSTPIIFYCNSGECWKSYKSAHTAVKAGYTKVYWMRGGMPEWKAKGFPIDNDL